jgi:predicted transcriptional regulator
MKRIIIVESMARFNDYIDQTMEWRIKNEVPLTATVMTPETFSKVFTPERIRLLQRIRRNKINNIYQLAKELKKPYEVVFRNVKYFESLGLIGFDKKSKKRVPHLTQDLKIDFFPNLAEA